MFYCDSFDPFVWHFDSKEVHYEMKKDGDFRNLKIYIPGVKKKNISVSYDSSVLNVKYDTNEIKFPASLLGEDFVIDSVQAKLEDGILYIDVKNKSKDFKKVEIY